MRGKPCHPSGRWMRQVSEEKSKKLTAVKMGLWERQVEEAQASQADNRIC